MPSRSLESGGPTPVTVAPTVRRPIWLVLLLSAALVGGILWGLKHYTADSAEAEQEPDQLARQEYADAMLDEGEADVERQQDTPETVPEAPPPSYGFYDYLEAGAPIPLVNGAYVNAEQATKELPQYQLQAASYRNHGDAQNLVLKLKARRLPAFITKSVSATGDYWYVVSVGPFRKSSPMNAAHDQLVELNIMPLKRRYAAVDSGMR